MAAQVRNSGLFRSKRSIADTVDHMVSITNTHFGTVESFINHDALVQLTCTKTQAYIEAKYPKKFIKPELNCNRGTVYEGRLIGNSPELNPLDCSLFADLTSANPNQTHMSDFSYG